MAEIYEIFGDDAHQMTMELLQAADAAAGIEPDAKIVLKPNLVTDSTPDQGATTHPGVLSGCLEYFSERGFQNLCVAEGSWVGAHTDGGTRSP